MATLGLVNIGALVTGRLADPRSDADVIFVSDGRIAAIGAGAGPGAASADVVVDCRGTTVIPGVTSRSPPTRSTRPSSCSGSSRWRCGRTRTCQGAMKNAQSSLWMT